MLKTFDIFFAALATLLIIVGTAIPIILVADTISHELMNVCILDWFTILFPSS